MDYRLLAKVGSSFYRVVLRWRVTSYFCVVAVAIMLGMVLWRRQRPHISYETTRIGTDEVRFVQYHFTPTRDRHAPDGFYVPLDVADSFRELDKMLPS